MGRWTTRRKSRKKRWCTTCDEWSIQPGDEYIEHKQVDDVYDGWMRLSECVTCFEKYQPIRERLYPCK